jgi:hypothetical protein
MTKGTAKQLTDILTRMSADIQANTQVRGDLTEVVRMDVEPLEWAIMRMQQIIEAASETPEEREERKAREDLGEEALYRGW